MLNEIWVFLETERDEIKKISLEMLSQARKIADSSGNSVSAIIAGLGIDSLSSVSFRYGADKLYMIGGESISQHDTDAHVNLLNTLVQASTPAILLLGATSLGKEIAPRLAARLNAGLISDCVDIKLEKGELVGRRPILNGKAHATIVCPVPPFCIVTAGAGVFDIHELRTNKQGDIISLTYLASEKSKVEFLEYVKGDPAKISLKEADIIIAIGRGMEKAENMRIIEELASLLGASMGGTRAAVDLKWLPLERQIGMTGLNVAPRLFISCGISGQYPHTVGMDTSETIIVINKDREAPMFKLAGLGIVGSLEEIVPVLSRSIVSFKKNKGQA